MRSEISLHELLVVQVLLRPPLKWWMSKEISEAILPHDMLPGGVAKRTVRSHVERLAHFGLLTVAEVYPGHRYRWSPEAGEINPDYLRRLREAADVLQVPIEILGERRGAGHFMPAYVEWSDGRFTDNPFGRTH